MLFVGHCAARPCGTSLSLHLSIPQLALALCLCPGLPCLLLCEPAATQVVRVGAVRFFVGVCEGGFVLFGLPADLLRGLAAPRTRGEYPPSAVGVPRPRSARSAMA